MTDYECRTCGKPFCRYHVPSKENDRDMLGAELPTICPWENSTNGVLTGKTKKADWRKG